MSGVEDELPDWDFIEIEKKTYGVLILIGWWVSATKDELLESLREIAKTSGDPAKYHCSLKPSKTEVLGLNSFSKFS